MAQFLISFKSSQTLLKRRRRLFPFDFYPQRLWITSKDRFKNSAQTLAVVEGGKTGFSSSHQCCLTTVSELKFHNYFSFTGFGLTEHRCIVCFALALFWSRLQYCQCSVWLTGACWSHPSIGWMSMPVLCLRWHVLEMKCGEDREERIPFIVYK